MPAPEARPHGSWPSPITPEVIVAKSVSIGEVAVGLDDVWWAEARPEEGGRVQLVRHRPGGDRVDVLPDGYAARTRVHEYGGGAWWLHGPDVVFANWADQRLYRLDGGADRPVALTPEPEVPLGDRYADGRVTADGRWTVCVRERHRPDGSEPANELVGVALRPDGDPADPVVLATGSDFVAAPRPSPDGRHLCWLRWNHPDMPWDGTELCVAPIVDGPDGSDDISVGDAVVVAGSRDESVTNPGWGPDGSLLFCSDRADWWNLYRLTADQVSAATDGPAAVVPEPAPVALLEAEIGVPHWVFDQSRWAVLADGRILVAFMRDGLDHLGVVEADGGDVVALASGITAWSSLRAFGSGAVAVGASPTTEAAVFALDVPDVVAPDGATAVSTVALRPPRELGIDVAWFSVPEPIIFATTGDRFAHALHYPPTNPEVVAPAGEAPPLIVMIHGGPTSAARPQLNLGVQFWTSRGFGVVDVNYGGSTGYGRRYRRRLNGEWGIVDVDDCVGATRYLVDHGAADRDRLIIRGGSAGGFTTLAALTFREVFAAGCSMYGVADLEALARDTHKFEARYLDSLVGPYPARRDLYEERSPIHHTDELECPLLVLQGLEDEVVPPAQSEMIVEALADKGVPHAYLAFEGEQHGFRQAATIVRALQAEASFYAQVLGFELSDDIEPLEITDL
ncbi:S9 family peptidase [Rhabdothermincola salaria]|uniref:S9 family peptidase n=1 Tax=Rhabdothermincola salaria TaxID=2903142 RepID=UPI001E390F96|nr:prolyl oligopeptidase family serine peptidase [Rhabdothermincola salaria]